MTRDEVRVLLAHAAAGTRDWAPSSVDVDVWLDLLGDLPYDDAKTALHAHASSTHHRPAPSDIRAGVKRIRADRLERSFDAVPDADPDQPADYLEALREDRMRTADGVAPRVMPELRRVFPALPSADLRPDQDRPDQAPRNAPNLTGLPPVDDEVTMAQARAEVAARDVIPMPDPEPAP